jgi:hypothetical protein
MNQGRRDVIGIHQINPGDGIGIGLVGVPDRNPLVGERGVMPLAVFSGELITVSDDGMLVSSRPCTVAATVADLADFNDMKRQWCVYTNEVSEDKPSVRFTGYGVVVEVIDGDPAMKDARFVGPGEGRPL